MHPYIFVQRALVRVHTAHMREVLGQERLVIIRIEINIQFFYLHFPGEREMTSGSSCGYTLRSQDCICMLRVCCQPVDLLRQYTLHSAGVIQMRNAIEDSHDCTSFFCHNRFSHATISFWRFVIPIITASSNKLHVTSRGSKRSGARG